MQESNVPKKQRSATRKKAVIGIGLFLLMMLGLTPVMIKAYHQKRLTQCKTNLRDLGKAMEKYSNDWDGHYPTELEKLVPKYIAEVPTCPNSGSRYQLLVGLGAPGNEANFDEYFDLYCEGRHHEEAGLGKDQPSFDPLGRPREPEF